MWLKCDLRTANSCTSGDYWDFDDSCCSCIDYWHFHILRQLNELCRHNKRISSKVLLLQGQAKMKCREYQFWGNHSCQKYQFWVTGPSLNRMPSLLSHPQGCHFPDGKKLLPFPDKFLNIWNKTSLHKLCPVTVIILKYQIYPTTQMHLP